MSLIPLRYHGQTTQLVIDLKLVYDRHTFSRPVPFAVDTAAERTFIVPNWQALIERECGKFRLVDTDTRAITLLGELIFRVVKGVKFFASDATGGERLLNDTEWACVSCTEGKAAKLALQKISVNILGRDILEGLTLYHNPHMKPHPTRFLHGRQQFICSFLRGHPQTKAYFVQPKPKTIAAENIAWID